MTDQTLADRIEHRLKLAERHGSLTEGREVYIRAKDLPAILSALREREVMREALATIARRDGIDNAIDPHGCARIARAALQGGGE